MEMVRPPFWEGLYQLDCMVNRAIYRLNHIADCEAVLGYEESAAMYRETAAEIGSARVWVSGVVRELHEKEQ